MKTEYRILISGFDYGIPKGLESLEIKFDFTGNKIKTLTSGNIEFHKSIHRDGYLQILSDYNNDRCFEKTWVLQYKKAVGFLTLDQGKIKGSGCVFSSEEYVSIELFPESGIEKLENNQSDEYVESPGVDVRLFQYESGGWIEDANGDYVTREMEPVNTILTNIGLEVGASINPIGPLTTSQQDNIYEFEILAVSSGDVFQLDMTSVLGSSFSVEVTANISDTVTTIAEKLCKGLLLMGNITATGFSITSLEMIHRLKNASNVLGVVTIESDWEIESLNLTQNAIPIITTETQGYQWGISDLYISSLGLKEDTDIQTSWGGLSDFLFNLFDAIVIDENPNISIDSYKNVFSTIPSSSVIESKYLLQADKDFLKKKGRFGSKFKLEGVSETGDNWEWIGADNVQDISIIIPPIASPGIIANAGIGSLTGSITYKNIGTTTEVYTIDLEVNLGGGGYVVVGSRTITIFPNQTYPPIEITSFFNNPSDNSFCFQAADLVRLIYSNMTNLTIPAGVVKVTQGKPCFQKPQIRENAFFFESVYNEFPDLANCDGIYQKGIDESIYSGLGYAVWQAYKNEAYEETTFIMLTEDDSGDQVAKKFLRRLYYPDDTDLDTAGCSCLKDSFVNRYFYNMVIQQPYIIEQFRNRLPVDVEVKAFDFSVTVDTLDIFASVTTIKTELITPSGNQLDTIDFDARIKLENFIKMRSEKKGLFILDSLTKTGIIQTLTFGLDGKQKSQKLRI